MSTDKGYIKVYRDIRDHWIWNYKPFSPQAAWIDLILLARKETASNVNFQAVIEQLLLSFIGERELWET